jgi:hypothetical protein
MATNEKLCHGVKGLPFFLVGGGKGVIFSIRFRSGESTFYASFFSIKNK